MVFLGLLAAAMQEVAGLGRIKAIIGVFWAAANDKTGIFLAETDRRGDKN